MLMATAWADVPFKTTTLVNGTFAENTTWYTLAIGANAKEISNNGTDKLTLGSPSTEATDENLWCFIGNDTDGYRIFNKKAGAGKALAAPTTMSGNNGGSSFAVLKDTLGLESSYTNRWDFKAATATTNQTTLTVENGWYVNEHGHSSNILNDRDNYLSFWSNGYDNGSAIVVTGTEFHYTVDMANGSFTSGNSNYSSVWTSSATNPTLTLTSDKNNMCKNAGSNDINMYSGQAKTSTYTLTAGAGYHVKGFSFSVKSATTGQTGMNVVIGSKTLAINDASQAHSSDSLTKQAATYVISGENHPVQFSNFKVTVLRDFTETEKQVNLFITDNTHTTPYRIPAIATTHNKSLLAVTDYRPGGQDVGSGHTNIVGKISTDNGQHWGDEFPILTGTGNMSNNNAAYGDPALVADAESGNVLLMCASGHIGYYSSSRSNPIRVTCKRSADNGQTWRDSTDMTEKIYGLFDHAKNGVVTRLFFTSGRIFQSQVVKEGQYRRIYAALCAGNSTTGDCNYVIYSDDFGQNWAVLGGTDVIAMPNGNEASCEELPDGTIVVSSRTGSGRLFNFFTYSDVKNGQGTWGTKANATDADTQPKDGSGGCNGELLIVPAKRTSDQAEVYVALQSVPFGSGRNNVGIYYKELTSLADVKDPAAFISDWDGKHQASYIGSAYSTMCVQPNDSIAFYYEESTFGKNYTEVYKQYSLERITDGKYSYYKDVDRTAFVKKILKERAEAATDLPTGTAVGMIDESKAGNISSTLATEVLAKYETDPTPQGYANAAASISEQIEAASVKLEKGKVYTLENKGREGQYLSVATSGTTYGQSTTATDDEQKFAFELQEDGQWMIYSKAKSNLVGPTKAVYNSVEQVSDISGAGLYTITSGSDGWSSIVCTNPATAAYPALHLDAYGKIVEWVADAPASLWKIVPTGEEIATDIEMAEQTMQAQPAKYYDLSGRQLKAAPKQGVYITSDKKKHIAR